MSWLDRVLGRSEKRVITLADFPQLSGFLSSPNTSGVSITEVTAFNLAAYWNGIDIISGQIGTLPFPLYRRLGDEQRERATTHPAYKVLTETPNSYMTPAVFWQTLMVHVLSWGNGYAEIEWDNAHRPIGLWTIPPDRLQPMIEKGRLRYRNSGPGAPYLEQEDVIHVPGLGFDGIQGYSVVANARRSLSLGMAAEEFGSSFFGNGAWPGLVLHHPGKLSQPAKERLEASFSSKYSGPAKAHKLLVAEEGMTLEAVGIPPEDAQYLQVREFQVLEIARWLNLPPHKLKHRVGERPGGNIEASQIEFLTDTLRPWLVRIEQEVDRKLIPSAQRGTLYSEHLVDAILRMDSAARAASYKSYFDMGVMDAETIAQKENLPKPKPKPIPVKVLPSDPPLALPPANDRQMRSALRALVADAVARFGRREAEKVKRAIRDHGAKGLSDLDAFYADEAMVFRGYLVPAVRLVLAHRGLDGDADEVTGGLIASYVERSKEELLALPARNVEEQAAQLVARWESNRPLDVAERVMEMRIEKREAAQPAPVVNVTVNVPEHASPVVQVDAPVITVNVPPARAAEVIVNNLPAPRVQIDAPVTVHVPSPAPLKVDRDASGVITGIHPAKG